MSTRQESSKKSKDPEEKSQKIKVSTSKKKAKSTADASEEQKDTDVESTEKPMHLYQCGNCKQILLSLFDMNNSVFANNSVPLRIVRDVKKEYNLDIKSDTPLISPETAFDALCVYYPICCKSCGALVGKVYLSLTEELENIQRHIPILEESQIKIFDVNGCKEVVTPKNPTSSTSANKDQPIRGSNLKFLPNKPEVLTMTKGMSAEKESMMPTNTTAVEYHHDLDQSKMFEVDSCFRDMKNVLDSFANLLGQFDMRMTNAERIIRMMNEQVTSVMKGLNDPNQL